MELKLNGRSIAITTHSITTEIPEEEALSNIKRELGVMVNFYNQTRLQSPLPFSDSEKEQFFTFIMQDSEFADQDFANKFSCGFWLPRFFQAAQSAFAENQTMMTKIAQIQENPLWQFLLWVDITTAKNQQIKIANEAKPNIFTQIDWQGLSNVEIAKMYNYSQQYVSTQRGIYAPDTVRPIIPKEVSKAFFKSADLTRSDSELANQFSITEREVRQLRQRKKEWLEIEAERHDKAQKQIANIVKVGEEAGIKTTLP